MGNTVKHGAFEQTSLNLVELLTRNLHVSNFLTFCQPHRITKQIKRIHVTAKGACKLAITGTKHLSDTASYTNVDFNPATTHKVDVRTSGRFMNLKVTMNGTTNPELSNLQFDIKVIGVR